MIDQEEQRIWADFEANRALVEALDAGVLTFTDEPVDAELPVATSDNVMIPKAFFLSWRLDEQVRAIAERRGIAVSAMLREWVTLQVAADAGDESNSRDDARQADHT